MQTANDILNTIKTGRDDAFLEKKKKQFNITCTNGYGWSQKRINDLVKRLPKENQLALDLFNSGIYEGKIICSKLYNPKDLTIDIINHWLPHFENWEITDSFCLFQFARNAISEKLLIDWIRSEEEFIKRSAFATIAGYTIHNKKAPNALFEQYIPLIKEAAHDNRNFVKKAVDWALRSIGKRNTDLKQLALKTALDLQRQTASKTAQWIGRNTYTELSNPNVRCSDYPRNKYRPN